MAKLSVDFAGFDEVLSKFSRLEAKKLTEEALKKGHEIVTQKAEEAVRHLPAGGRYSSGRTAASLKRDAKITWNGTVGSVDIGFNIKKGGLPSIFMMYGSPRYMKVQQMYDAFYSSQTEGEVLAAAKEIFERAMGELE